jgi:hypothetical protein
MTDNQNHLDKRFIIKFIAANGFTVVLEVGSSEWLAKIQKQIEEAGLKYDLIPSFDINFDESDLYMDLRSPVCNTQFDLQDWL